MSGKLVGKNLHSDLATRVLLVPDQYYEVNWESSPTTFGGAYQDLADNHQVTGTL